MPLSRSPARVDRFARPQDLPPGALALMSRAEQHHIEFGADWFALLVEAVYAPQAAQVCFYVLSEGDRTLAVLATVAQVGAAGHEVSALSNFYTAVFAPALADAVGPQDLQPLMQALRRDGQGAAAYRFAPMDPDSREFGLLAGALRLTGLSVHRYFAFGNWHEPIDETWESYLQRRSSQVRNTIKRNAKKFAAQGGRLEIVQGGERLEAGLAAYQAVYAQSWKVPEPYPGFMPGLIRLCARRGWLRLGVAWLGEQPVAAQLWIVANGRADIYKLAYDEAYKAFAPGTLLTARLMEQALDVDQVREVDYLIGDDPYKAAWMSRRRERVGLIAYDPLTPRGLLGLLRQRAGDLRRRLRSQPAPAPTTAP